MTDNEDKLHVISEEWNCELETEILSAKIMNSLAVDLVVDDISKLVNKTPVAIEFNGNRYDCKYYTQMVTMTISILNAINHDKLIAISKNNHKGRITYSETPNVQGVASSRWIMSNVENIYVDVHGSSEEHGNFIKSMLNEFGVESFIVYLK